MKNKLKIISFLISLVLVISIICICFIAHTGRLNSYFIAVPKINGAGVPIKAIEEVNENKGMLTYENTYDRSVKALQSNYGVILKGTNYTYPYVMNYSMTSGGFFPKEAFENKNKVAVINEKASFDIFGTLDAAGNEIQIDMAPYIVSGVINDNDNDNLNVFIPATCLAETTETVMANLALDDGLTEEYVKNELKHIGINEQNYNFVNIGLLINLIEEKAFVSLEIILFGFLLIALKISVKSLIEKLKIIKRRQQQLYFKEMLKDKEKPVQKLVFLLTAIAGTIIAELLLSLNLFERFLNWSGVIEIFYDINYTGYAMNVLQIEKYYRLSNILFIAFVFIFTVFLGAIWDCKKPWKE